MGEEIERDEDAETQERMVRFDEEEDEEEFKSFVDQRRKTTSFGRKEDFLPRENQEKLINKSDELAASQFNDNNLNNV